MGKSQRHEHEQERGEVVRVDEGGTVPLVVNQGLSLPENSLRILGELNDGVGRGKESDEQKTVHYPPRSFLTMEVVQAGEEGHGTDSDQEHFLERPIRHAGRMAFPGGIAEEDGHRPGDRRHQEAMGGFDPHPKGPDDPGHANGRKADTGFPGIHPGKPEGEPRHREKQQASYQPLQKFVECRARSHVRGKA